MGVTINKYIRTGLEVGVPITLFIQTHNSPVGFVGMTVSSTFIAMMMIIN